MREKTYKDYLREHRSKIVFWLAEGRSVQWIANRMVYKGYILVRRPESVVCQERRLNQSLYRFIKQEHLEWVTPCYIPSRAIWNTPSDTTMARTYNGEWLTFTPENNPL